MPLQLNDRNASVRQWRHVMNARFGGLYTRLHGPLPEDTDVFGPRAVEWQKEYEARTQQVQDGEVSDVDLIALKIPIPPPPKRPIIITVEGHMSDMWIGPCAAIGAQMEAERLAFHQPTAYDRTALPFKNQTGVDAVLGFLNSDNLMDGSGHPRPFPLDLDWYLLGFSQGSIITNKVWMKYLKNAPAGSRLAARRDHLKRAIAFGDPWREKNADAGWWPDPPKKDTQGISDERMVNTPSWWKSANRHGDLYSENPDNDAGLYRTSIYKIAAENSWSGGPAGMLMRLMDLLTPTDDIIPLFQAIIGGVLFLGNMNPHGGYNLDAPTDYIRQGLLGR